MRQMLSMLVLGGLLQAIPARAQAAGGAGIAERVGALKESLAASAKNLRAYQWIETTTVSLKGEQKSMKQFQCYYGADGVLQKIPIAATQAKTPGGLRGKIAANKKEELTAEMQQAVALVKSYVPPDPMPLEAAKAAGKVSMDMLEPGKIVRLVFRDYRLPGDSLGITLNVITNQLAGLNVASYMNQPSKPVTMTTQMGALVDGTTYPASIQLTLPAENLSVNIANTGYRKM